MAKRIVDLRSDTLTKPSEAMRSAMAEAKVGDDVFGEDPSINLLEDTCAELTGKEAALFVPSGSMANLVAQMHYVRRGDEVIIGAGSHCFRYEVGAGAAIAGAQYVVIDGSGLFTAGQAAARIRPPSFHTPGTALLWVENTHNFGGGLVFPYEELKRIRNLGEEHVLPVHMDGARVFNAAAASGRSVKEIADLSDSISFCFSKGLGAPVGSILCCSKAMRDSCRRFRKMVGGGMRQAGVLAAAALYAIEHNVERLAEDHANARVLAENIAAMKDLSVDMQTVQTNIVIVQTGNMDAQALVDAIGDEGTLTYAIARGKLRFVTHLDVTREDMDTASQAIERALKKMTHNA